MFAFFKKLFGFPTPAEEAAAKAPSKLDLNADGKVDTKDAVVAVRAVKAAAKGAAGKAKATVAKAKQPKAPAKPRAKKPAADKK